MCADQPEPQPPAPSRLTRRHVLVAGAAAGGFVALRGLPALGQEDGDFGGSTTSSTSTTTTTTTPSSTTTTTAPPLSATPVPPSDPAIGRTQSYATNLPDSPDKGIMFPLLGRPNSRATWSDTYGACRDGCSRAHQGQDLIAPQMTKILSVCDGTIVEFRSRPDGTAIWIQGNDGWFYSYLHVNDERPGSHSVSSDPAFAWAPALRQYVGNTTTEARARGRRVKRGEFLAYVGDSGNAEGTYQLHFEIRKPASGSFSSETQRMWSSAAVNPRVSLERAEPAREASSVPPETFRPWSSSMAFVVYQFQDFFGRTASTADITYWGGLLDSGSKTPDWVMQFYLQSDEGDSKAQAVARLYQAYYRRLPDSAGFNYWLDKRRAGGWSLQRISEQFSRAPEFVAMYGSRTDEQFVDLAYQNVLGRAPDSAGRAYWLEQLRTGTTRGRMMIGLSESPEYTTAQKVRMDIVGLYGVMLERVPTGSELSTWTSHLSGGGSNRDMIAMLRASQEYATVVAG